MADSPRQSRGMDGAWLDGRWRKLFRGEWRVALKLAVCAIVKLENELIFFGI
jgi:hypothetical protein